jgi:hypothetical protein
VAGFVAQIMHRMLTIKEILTFNANVSSRCSLLNLRTLFSEIWLSCCLVIEQARLPASLGERQKAAKVNEVIKALGLVEIRSALPLTRGLDPFLRCADSTMRRIVWCLTWLLCALLIAGIAPSATRRSAASREASANGQFTVIAV